MSSGFDALVDVQDLAILADVEGPARRKPFSGSDDAIRFGYIFFRIAENWVVQT